MQRHKRFGKLWDRLVYGLAALAVADRALKTAAIAHYFHRPPPQDPRRWPVVSLLQPITQGAHSLRRALRARAQFAYPAAIQHIFICDRADARSQRICRDVMAEFPHLWARLVLVDPTPGMTIAAKLPKLQAGLALAEGEIICFMDDDIIPHTDTLRRLIPYALQPGVGAACGLPCHTNWGTVWSALLSGFVNLNTLPTFVGELYLAPPVRLIGHIAAYTRQAIAALDGLRGLESYPDDDFEITRCLVAHGLRVVLASVVYSVDNGFASWHELDIHLTRWYVLPRQAMAWRITPRQRAAMAAITAGVVVPPLAVALGLAARRRSAWGAAALTLAGAVASYAWTQARITRYPTPPRRWLLMPLIVFLMPLHTIKALLSHDVIEWRGQRMRVRPDGRVAALSEREEHEPSQSH
jgi:cellulose synthase/poly-beta-1,6-N-acetylglucosamine synthase-like glycosyltransferase